VSCRHRSGRSRSWPGWLNFVDLIEQAKRRAEALLNAPLDRWVALSEDESRVVADGSTYDEVVRKAEAAGVSEPVIIKTPHDWTPHIMVSIGGPTLQYH
jgi:hypothetical protein